MIISYEEELKLRFDQLKNLDNLDFVDSTNLEFYKKFLEVRIAEINYILSLRGDQK